MRVRNNSPDMDSYRVSKQHSAKIDLASEAASIYRIPVSEGGSLTEKLFDLLEAIIEECNKRHGDREMAHHKRRGSTSGSQ